VRNSGNVMVVEIERKEMIVDLQRSRNRCDLQAEGFMAYVSQIEDDQVGYRDKRSDDDLELMCLF
jgi:hypothetical protein